MSVVEEVIGVFVDAGKILADLDVFGVSVDRLRVRLRELGHGELLDDDVLGARWVVDDERLPVADKKPTRPTRPQDPSPPPDPQPQPRPEPLPDPPPAPPSDREAFPPALMADVVEVTCRAVRDSPTWTFDDDRCLEAIDDLTAALGVARRAVEIERAERDSEAGDDGEGTEL